MTNGTSLTCSFQGFTAINADLPGKPIKPHELKVGDYCLTSEISIKNKTFYYVVKILELGSDTAVCEWYQLKDRKKLFVKLTANWRVVKTEIMTVLDAPAKIDEGRRGRILFPEVYKFQVGKDFEQ